MTRIPFFISFLLLITGVTFAQNDSTKQDNAYAPFSPEETMQLKAPTKRAKKGKKKKNAYQQFEISREQKIKEFEERMEDNSKRYKKQQREMLKPQYSDPTYFGHKRKPKIRKRGKKKFCKECGIVH